MVGELTHWDVSWMFNKELKNNKNLPVPPASGVPAHPFLPCLLFVFLWISPPRLSDLAQPSPAQPRLEPSALAG